MLEEKRYTLSELREALKKSTQEFEPKLGDGVTSGNKTNNGKAMKDIEKSVKDYDGGVKQVRRTFDKPFDRNKTTIDLNFNETKPGKEWEERTKANAYGYPSVKNMETSDVNENESLDYDGNKEFYDDRKKIQKELNAEVDFKVTAGIAGNDKRDAKEIKEPTNESKTLKRLHFKKTTFINESDMLSRVPEDYKVDGNRFFMKDATGTEYMIECKVDKEFNYPKLIVKGKLNENREKSQIDRMKQLFGYNSSDYFTSADKSIESGSSLHENIQTSKGVLEILKENADK